MKKRMMMNYKGFKTEVIVNEEGQHVYSTKNMSYKQRDIIEDLTMDIFDDELFTIDEAIEKGILTEIKE